METKKFQIVNAQSNIDWTGRKVTGAHNGTIGIKDGTLIFTDGKLSGGNFVIDTTSIKILDVADPATNAQFAGHLASDDFFSIDKYPEATLQITSVSANHVQGDLTIKGITHPVAFDITINASNGDTVTASGKLVIDRTKYGIKFRSGNFFKDLGDTLIYNDFDLDVTITAKAA
ncbi:YceI family protein [Chitinophaga ginsengisoli]|uniref:Polyisoprenoid-binding protein YceI n=1 Tax=Chitinophaga ginsengisoli TaxID=363837 RepID=A0A2P8GM39_9BACT|nr:YceI family protein [Chitinophaga ginsengisoli]PSL35023.1 polyisoprenoid-binding protein YceI [Chitinophaga ginsengisoli]